MYRIAESLSILYRYGIVGMGVADGVYAWKERGIDAGLFSRTLMSRARKEVDAGLDDVVKCKSQKISVFCPLYLASRETTRISAHRPLSQA